MSLIRMAFIRPLRTFKVQKRPACSPYIPPLFASYKTAMQREKEYHLFLRPSFYLLPKTQTPLNFYKTENKRSLRQLFLGSIIRSFINKYRIWYDALMCSVCTRSVRSMQLAHSHHTVFAIHK